MTELIVRDVHKTLGALQILKGASFTAERGRILALLGASGSGKTTLLRCVAGLEQPERGHITIGDRVVQDSAKGIILPPEARNIGLVFQSYALWPHKKVMENVLYGLVLRGVAKAEAEARARKTLEIMGLGHLADRYPDQLSGGQQQRVAICRALVYEPRVLLMDEPLSNLDAKLREEARYWIRKLILDLGICAIMVTHDQTEALAIADHILLLKDGVIVQEGSPIEVYSQPNCFYSADFLGVNNVVKGRLQAVTGGGVVIGGQDWALNGVLRDAKAIGRTVQANDDATAVIRVERVAVSDKAGDQPGVNRLEMTLDACIYLGDRWEYRLSRGDLRAKAHGFGPLNSTTVWCDFPPDDVWVFAA